MVRYSLMICSGLLKRCFLSCLSLRFLCRNLSLLLSTHSSLAFLFFSTTSGMYVRAWGTASSSAIVFFSLEEERERRYEIRVLLLKPFVPYDFTGGPSI